MSNLQIFSNSIRQIDNLYSLTDLHKASGGNEKHKPVLFLRLDQTKDLISEIENDKVQICTLAVKTVRGGTNPSTYACKEIVIAYAAWISPQFHLVVLRAFLNQLENSQNSDQNRPLVEERKIQMELPEKQWLRFVSMWYACYNNVELLKTIEKPLRAIGSPIGTNAYTHATEYGTLLGVMQRIMLPMFADFHPDPLDDKHHFHALKTLREYTPQGLGKVVKL